MFYLKIKAKFFANLKIFLKKIFDLNEKEDTRNLWLEKILKAFSPGLKILDVGAGELKNKKFCEN